VEKLHSDNIVCCQRATLEYYLKSARGQEKAPRAGGILVETFYSRFFTKYGLSVSGNHPEIIYKRIGEKMLDT